MSMMAGRRLSDTSKDRGEGVTENPRNNPMQSKRNDLEAIEKLIQRYRQTRNMKKAAMDLNTTTPANH